MGLFDFLKKGEEKPVEKKPNVQPKPAAPAANTASATSNQVTPHNTPSTAAQPKVYTIKSGDSLSKIAKQFYGDANQWSKIHKANLDKIKDPNLIHPGEQIIIP
jgi:nucleoid-associated protein YgaU